jgi:glycosyltransferase involved in cell wall biosynthesis
MIQGVYQLPVVPLTISRAVASELDARFGCRVHAVIAQGIDTDAFHPVGVLREPRTVFMLFHPDPRKGLPDGLRALERVRARLPDVRVRMCGVLPPDGLPSWVEYVRFPSDDELRLLYARATVFLYPSRYEGFGLPPLEAMACACPVVSTRVGAIPEYSRDGVNALLVPPGAVDGMSDALHHILCDPNYAAALARKGLQTARTWTIASAAGEFTHILKGLCHERPDQRIGTEIHRHR